MSDDEFEQALVIDNGTWMCKAGWAGDDTARAYVRTIVGEHNGKKCFDYAAIKQTSDSHCPMERGIVTDWDAMEDLWCHVLEKELRIDKKCKLPMLMTEVPHNPKGNREKMAQILIEKFDVDSLCFFDPGELTIIASGRTTGIALDVGHSVTYASPLFEGFHYGLVDSCLCFFHFDVFVGLGCPIKEAVRRIDLGGQDVTMHLSKMLQDLGYSFSTRREMHLLEEMKYNIGFEEQFGERSRGDNSTRSYTLPDGTKVEQTEDIMECQRLLFEPSLQNLDLPGIHEVLYGTICACPRDIVKDICHSITLAGGATMCRAFQDYTWKRLNQLKLRDCKSFPFRITAPPERRKSVWIGGSIMASLSGFSNYCKSKHDYYEHGPTIFHTD